MPFRHSPLALALCAALSPAIAHTTVAASTPCPQSSDIAEVVVTGQRGVSRTQPVSDNHALAAAVTTVDASDIANTNVGRDISAMFRRVPGVVANNLDQGDTGYGLRMRGFATGGTHGQDVAVYIDGVPQNMPSSQAGGGHGPAFIEWLVPAMIERADVIKGPASALFADQNRSGAVDIRTREGGAATPSSIAFGMESYGAVRGTAVWSARFGRAHSLLIADRYRSGGYRHASRTARDNVLWKLSGDHGDAHYSLRLNHYQASADAAGYLLLDDLESGRASPKDVQFGLPAATGGHRTTLVFQRTPRDEAEGWSYSVYAENFSRFRATSSSPVQQTVGADDRRIFGGRIRRDWILGDAAIITAGVDLRRDAGDADRRIFRSGSPSDQYLNALELDLRTWGVFAQAQWRVTSGLKISGGLRRDWFDYNIVNRKLPAASTHYRSAVTTPKLGFAWDAGAWLQLYGNIGEGFRSPAAEQISSSGKAGPLGAPGGSVFDVAPSKVRSADVGVMLRPADGVQLDLNAFRVINSDEIISLPDGSWRAMGQTTRLGFDVAARWAMRDGPTLYASYGRINMARANNPLPGQGSLIAVPESTLKGGLQQHFDMGRGVLRLNLDGFLLHRVPTYVGTPMTRLVYQPTYTRYDLRAAYDIDRWEFTAHATLQPQRFASEAVYGTAQGLMVVPQPRVLVGASVRYTFR